GSDRRTGPKQSAGHDGRHYSQSGGIICFRRGGGGSPVEVSHRPGGRSIASYDADQTENVVRGLACYRRFGSVGGTRHKASTGGEGGNGSEGGPGTRERWRSLTNRPAR